MEILAVTKDGVANELGVRAGDELLAFDGYPVLDVLDYEFYNSRTHFRMRIRSRGEVSECEVEKDEDEDLGLELSREIPIRQCRNRCIFCFVDQLPKEELRSTLRVKDDDYRHSFIFGNYVTLTNVTDRELGRIVRLGLSPIYVSVHTSDPVLRSRMLGAGDAPIPDIRAQLRTLHAGGIRVHAQIVYCPHVNEDIDRTIADIEPYTESLAVVPVGLTREANPALRPVAREDAERVLQIVERWQEKLLARRGTRYVFAADELYLKAGKPIPAYETYENFSQIENGVGLAASFRHEFDVALSESEGGEIGEVSMATGVSAYPLICACARELEQKFGGKIHVYRVRNEFFGESVTVAGLLVGRDILRTLSDKPLGTALYLPSVMLREFSDVFLDGMTVDELSVALGVPVRILHPDGESFVRAFTGEKTNG